MPPRRPAVDPAPPVPQVQPATPATPAGCDALRDRVVSANQRAKAILHDLEENAAKYLALADVMQKLASDLDRPFAPVAVAGLASDYRGAATAFAGAAREIAAVLADSHRVSTALSASGDVRVEWKRAVDTFVTHRDNTVTAPDCAPMIRLLVRLEPTKARIDATRAGLAEVVPVTPGVKEDIVRLRAA